MYTKILRISAITAILIGLLSVIAGTRTLMGLYDPGYKTFKLLIIYNVLMGFISLVAGFQTWNIYAFAKKLSGIILLGHLTVLIILLSLFNQVIAVQSILAMMFRVVVWIVIFISIYKSYSKRKFRLRKGKNVFTKFG